MRHIHLLLWSFPFLASCAAAPPGPPEELASTLLSELDAGRTSEARELFELVEDDAEYRDKIYPVLYGAARARYQDGNASGAAVVLRFLHAGYPEAVSVREAFLYSLFLERAGKGAPEPAVASEIDELLAELREQPRPENSAPPVWIDLIEAQHRLDRGESAQAREAYARFLASWDRRPNEALLALYVDDIGRHLGPESGR